jgi:hypothetical protein
MRISQIRQLQVNYLYNPTFVMSGCLMTLVSRACTVGSPGATVSYQRSNGFTATGPLRDTLSQQKLYSAASFRSQHCPLLSFCVEITFSYFWRRRSESVQWLDRTIPKNRGSIPGRGTYFTFHYRVKVGSGANTAFYPMGTFPEGKLTTHLHLVSKSGMRGVTPPLPHTSSERYA